MKTVIKAFILGIVVAGLAAFVLTKLDVHISLKKNEVQAEEKATIMPKEIKIDEEAVFGKMKEKAIIVGLEKEIVKTNGTDDSAKTGWDWFDKKALSKKLIYEAHGKFFMGLDMTGFNQNDINVDSETGTVTVYVPKPTLISLELPYEKCKFTYEKGLFRRGFTKKDEQMIWEQIRESAEEDIANDEESLEKAKEASHRFIGEMLLHIEGVKKVNFIEN